MKKREESYGIVLINEENNIILINGLYEIKSKKVKGIEYYIDQKNIIEGNDEILFKKCIGLK